MKKILIFILTFMTVTVIKTESMIEWTNRFLDACYKNDEAALWRELDNAKFEEWVANDLEYHECHNSLTLAKNDLHIKYKSFHNQYMRKVYGAICTVLACSFLGGVAYSTDKYNMVLASLPFFLIMGGAFSYLIFCIFHPKSPVIMGRGAMSGNYGREIMNKHKGAIKFIEIALTDLEIERQNYLTYHV